ncbi:uncharacterized protein STEHIDRAFT_116286 [Stereum hirsutum FP-91666 SS1]|uniref:Uncharacterized protein n=1 Tax=Stereum hirsutum (strain FP-91666) TaxID=721885 RepID=R7RY39_STEHR|nr:uncharacterized protein STEHIDRAFT_116286 [Stereum hirsutum FP-91666 SS1]EIM79810.1 hypothetical protein STEHIDRAFT_116286 [Stereum hirsutum FP-91666 SS1]
MASYTKPIYVTSTLPSTIPVPPRRSPILGATTPSSPKAKKRVEEQQVPSTIPRSVIGLGADLPLSIPYVDRSQFYKAVVIAASLLPDRTPLPQLGNSWVPNSYSRQALPPLTVPSYPPMSHSMYSNSPHSLHPIPSEENGGSRGTRAHRPATSPCLTSRIHLDVTTPHHYHSRPESNYSWRPEPMKSMRGLWPRRSRIRLPKHARRMLSRDFSRRGLQQRGLPSVLIRARVDHRDEEIEEYAQNGACRVKDQGIGGDISSTLDEDEVAAVIYLLEYLKIRFLTAKGPSGSLRNRPLSAITTTHDVFPILINAGYSSSLLLVSLVSLRQPSRPHRNRMLCMFK